MIRRIVSVTLRMSGSDKFSLLDTIKSPYGEEKEFCVARELSL